MDKNQVIGLLLSALLLLVYFQFFAPKPIPGDEVVETEAAASAQDTTRPPVTTAPDAARQAAEQQQYGEFATAVSGEAREVVLENENIRVVFTTQGGRPKSVALKKYNQYGGGPVVLLADSSNQISSVIKTSRGDIDLMDLYYQTDATDAVVAAGDSVQITFTATLANGQAIRQIYTLAGDKYQIGYNLSLPNGVLADQALTFHWKDALMNEEKDIEESRRRSQLNYYTAEGDLEDLSSLTGGEELSETVTEPIKWIGMKQRFFTSAIIARSAFAGAELETLTPEEGSPIVKLMEMEVAMPLNNGNLAYQYFFGPNDQRVMESVAPDFEGNINFGWPVVGWISKYVISPIFHFMEGYIGNYGLIIVLLVLLVKTILFPLSYKSYVSMAKMKVLKPDLDEIKEKYGDDMAAAQKEQMQLYGKVGVNPISGCVPVLLQMPILLAMFNFFPNSIELRQEPFLWTDDLSTYDSIATLPFEIPFYGDHVSLFVILMTLSSILYAWSNSQASTVQGPMKTMQYFFPVLLMFVLNSFPAALSFYYFVSNIVTFSQQAIIRQFVDDDKIRKTLDENKKRNVNKKKSKFQQRIEDAMKASQETQQQRKGKPNKPTKPTKPNKPSKRKSDERSQRGEV